MRGQGRRISYAAGIAKHQTVICQGFDTLDLKADKALHKELGS